MRSSRDMIRIFQSSFLLFFNSNFGDCNFCWTQDRVLTVGELYNLKRFCVINIVSAKPGAPTSFTPGSLCSTYTGSGESFNDNQGSKHFKLLLSAPTFVEKIPVSVKYYAYFIPVEHSSAICDGYYRNNWYKNTNIHSKYFNFALIVKKFTFFCDVREQLFCQVSRIRRNSDWAQIGSGAGSTPRLWALDTGLQWPGAGLTSVCHHYRQYCDNQCHNLAFIITTNKNTPAARKKAALFTRVGRPRGIPAVGAGANILHSPTSILLCT